MFCCVFCSGVIAAPAKLATKTNAAKLPPAGAVGAKVIKKQAKVVKKAVEKAPVDKDTKKTIRKIEKKTPTPDKIVEKNSVVEKFAPQLKNEKKQEKKKQVKMRKQVVDGKVCMWGRTAEDAERFASEAVRKFVGKRSDFQFKDSVIATDGGKFYCMLRFNYTDKIPETWYLESEMVTGFGKNKLRAFADAVSRAKTRVKTIHSSGDWQASNSSLKDSSDMGFIPYDFVFATAGKTVYCKIFFRYLKPR